MRRYMVELVATLALVLFVTPFAADAQRPGHVPRIGWLALASPPLIELEGLRQGLRELGYVEGQNIVIEDRYAEGKSERLPDLVAELVRLKVDVLLAAGGAPTRAAKQGTTTTPIVSVSGDPVAAGFVLGLARPGGNITGLTQFTTELSGKRLELLKETLPRLTRVAVLAYTAAPLTDLRTTESAAQALGMQLQRLEIQEPAELEHAFTTMTRARADALIVLPSQVFFALRTQITELAAQHRLPAMYEGKEFVEAGGLISYGPSVPDLFRRTATYVDKILKGAKPADLPVEQPTKFELIINLKTAEALGLTIPPTLLFQADEVIR
jgi:putative tryptophan/tyrosine transport system substrate-binding protein